MTSHDEAQSECQLVNEKKNKFGLSFVSEKKTSFVRAGTNFISHDNIRTTIFSLVPNFSSDRSRPGPNVRHISRSFIIHLNSFFLFLNI